MVRHPNFKLKNARRLIAALEKAAPAEIARRQPLMINGSHIMKGDSLRKAVDAEGTDPDPSAIPVAYDQGTWACAIDTGDSAHFCGTAACIAGFAHLMHQADQGSPVRLEGFSRFDGSGDTGCVMVRDLADFLGIEKYAAEMMSAPCGLSPPPRPRHAVAMLEYFIRTGRVDWKRALGIELVERSEWVWKGLWPRRKVGRTEWRVTEAERALQEMDARVPG